MHVSFIPYGERSIVEKLFREMEQQKHLMPMWKKHGKGMRNRQSWIPGQIRQMPGGVYEYVFPKENLDRVLRTMGVAGSGDIYGVNFKKLIYPLLRKVLKLKPVPKYGKEGDVYLWTKMYVAIIILGIREDGDVVGIYTDDKGWTHEALCIPGR